MEKNCFECAMLGALFGCQVEFTWRRAVRITYSRPQNHIFSTQSYLWSEAWCGARVRALILFTRVLDRLFFYYFHSSFSTYQSYLACPSHADVTFSYSTSCACREPLRYTPDVCVLVLHVFFFIPRRLGTINIRAFSYFHSLLIY